MLRPLAVLLLAAATTALGQTAPIVRHRAPIVTEPVPGFRLLSDAPLATVTSSDDTVELRLDHGRATVYVDHPSPDTLLLLDTPGGQVDFTRDGAYTINADTGILRVLRGEAEAFPPNAPENARGTAVREGEQVTLADSMHPGPSHDLRADLVAPSPGGIPPSSGWADRYDEGWGYPAYGYAPWGWNPWGYPGWGSGPWAYSAWGWDPWLYPGWGFGVGIGWPWGWGGYGLRYPYRYPGGFAGPGRGFPPRAGGFATRGFNPGVRTAPGGGGSHPSAGSHAGGGSSRR